MRNKILFLLILVLTLPCLSFADNFVNLTPQPRTMNVAADELVLPQKFVVSTTDLPEEMVEEALKFVKVFNATTGYEATVSNDDTNALFKVQKSIQPLNEEGYKIKVSAEGVHIEASTPQGLYFAFQTLKKVLPPHVMAGCQPQEPITQYALPMMTIDDAPRFGYRGFMLDTSRHFFSVKEIKRVLEVMSYYKMNRFHWHLTDDQGWRIEIKKYPRLTTIGSISDNSYMVDMNYGDYWLNHQYGPYFYTQKDVKEVVAYAKERHIEIIPEIDMPGHFCAAMAAYPEFSCTPDGGHQVISNIGGVYNDVLNVANPKAVQFAKDILTEIMEMFPGEYIHIGGDECPTTAWERNAECIAKKEEMGLQSFRELQSHFIKDMAEHLKANGRKISVWNEAISANGADTRTIKETGATVYCWTGADGAVNKAASLGLNHIYTPQVPWYINRRQSTDPSEPVGAGPGTDNLEVVYKQNIPVPTNSASRYFSGVQATFWSEYVAFGNYLEYLMLPRLVAIAEAGWTPKAKMNFPQFCQRITADSALYNYNQYSYGHHYMKNADSDEKVMPKVSTETQKHWYRLITRAAAPRANKCIELLSATSPLLQTYKNKGAQEGRLWTNDQMAETDAASDYQFWALEENASQKGHYALVCKAQPQGSLHPVPTAPNNSGRWKYDSSKKHYNFILADNGYGKDGENYFYSIRCDQIKGWWLNAAMAGQGFAVNLYNNPSDGNGGLWKFVAKEKAAEDDAVSTLLEEARRYLAHVRTYEKAEDKRPGYFGAEETAALRAVVAKANPEAMDEAQWNAFKEELSTAYRNFRQSFGYLEKEKIYAINNAVEGFENVTICDTKEGNILRNSREIWTDNAWRIVETTVNADFSQTVKWQNVHTFRFIGTTSSQATAKSGYGVTIGNSAAKVTCTFSPETQDFVLSINGKNLYPLLEKGTNSANTIFAGNDNRAGNAIRPQGAAWNLVESRLVTYDCIDEEENSLGTYRRTWPVHDANDSLLTPPLLHNYRYVQQLGDKYKYARTAFDIQVVCRDQYGALLNVEKHVWPTHQDFTQHIPELPYYTFEKAGFADNEPMKIVNDTLFEITYSTTAINGVKCLGDAVTEIKPGYSYVLYDLSPNDGSRKGYRKVNPDLQVMRNHHIDDTTPEHTWIIEKFGYAYKVKNMLYQQYVPLLQNSTPAKLSAVGGQFYFTLNADKNSWKIKGSNGVCWDGLSNGALVGWNDPGHPYSIYEYYAQPYFKVTVSYVDTEGKELRKPQQTWVKAGEAFPLTTDAIEGYTLHEILGNEGLSAVSDHTAVTVIYLDNDQTGIEEIQSETQAKGIYDLSGRRLQQVNRRGIYIVNGQKVLVK